jgi:uncharacterized protein YdeI (YjbR/CyaY-like superfamily)
METYKELPVLQLADRATWQQWLEQNFTREDGVWLKFAKKGSNETTINYAEALEEALCYGWIDALVNKFDDKFYLQKFTPRRKRSVWSQINVGKAEKLIADGRMKPSGLEQVAAAKADGRWEQAYASPSKMEVHEDFQKALKENPNAKEFFETLNQTNKYAIYWRVQTARKPETRERRIKQLVEMLEADQKLH